MNYDFSGKIHAISKDYAGCCVKLDYKTHENRLEDLSKFIHDFLNKYAEYLFQFDKELALSMIFHKLKEEMHSTDIYQIIYRPEMEEFPDLISTIALKFKRCEKDNL